MRFPETLPALLLALAACGAPAPAPSDDEPPPDSAAMVGAGAAPDTTFLADLSCDGLAWALLPVTPTRAELRQAFGAPDTVIARAVENRHVPGQTDSVFTVRYDGLEVVIYGVTGGRELPDEVTVTDAGFLALPALGPGAPAARLVRALGEPTTRTAQAMTWSCGIDVEEPVTFRMGDDVVRRIEIDYYVD